MIPQNMIPGIKLFGRKIPAPEIQIPVKSHAQIPTESQVKHGYSTISKAETVQTGKLDNEEPGHPDKPGATLQCREGQLENNDQEQEKSFKKPDKILPCPRCNSLETKFCYFNNYNVNQPRHFCKNCQRYWTAGGTMRNVPVGAGRRKNKQFASPHYRPVLSVNGAVPPYPGVEAPEPANQHMHSPGEYASSLSLTPPEVTGSTVLKFGPEATLSQSMDSALNIRDRRRSVEKGPVSFSGSREEPSSTSELESDSSGSFDSNRYPPQQIPTLFFPYHSALPLGAHPAQVTSNQWRSPPVAISGVCSQTTIPLHVIPASYLGCVPVAVVNGCLSPPSLTGNKGSCSGSGSPMLGKHSRGGIGDPERSDSSIAAPKTPRMEGPDEASRSTIWHRNTLGINPHEKVHSSKLNSLVERKGNKSEGAADVIDANPAALSRSQTFQEST